MQVVPKKRTRATIQKQHYWLQIDFQIRADTLESAIERCGKLFRKSVRGKLRPGLVYMGAYSATCHGGLSQPRTMHPTVILKKGLPIEKGVPLATLDAEEAARIAAKALRKSAAPVGPGPSKIPVPQKPKGLAGLMK